MGLTFASELQMYVETPLYFCARKQSVALPVDDKFENATGRHTQSRMT